MRALLAAASLLALGCASIARTETPAVIVDPTTNSRAELLEIITSVLGRTDVMLAPDALTTTDVLLIERTPVRRSGQRLNGREFGRPEQFQLVTDGSRCTLVHSGTGKRVPLKHTRCAPMKVG